jgi:hypothetical protein
MESFNTSFILSIAFGLLLGWFLFDVAKWLKNRNRE